MSNRCTCHSGAIAVSFALLLAFPSTGVAQQPDSSSRRDTAAVRDTLRRSGASSDSAHTRDSVSAANPADSAALAGQRSSDSTAAAGGRTLRNVKDSTATAGGGTRENVNDSTATAGGRTRANVNDSASARGGGSSAGKSARRTDTASTARRASSATPAPVWPVKGPAPLPGAILPNRRIVAYYGNPLSRRMGILGEVPPDEMLRRLDREVEAWRRADPATPVQPALHLVAVVAQADAGRSGKWRLRMTDALIERVAAWAAQRDALVFLDVQVGQSTLQEELPRLAEFLARPNFHLGIDPEFAMPPGVPPGKKVGSFDAADINYAVKFLAELAAEHDIPPKVLVIHRFTQKMVTNTHRIRLDPHVQIVIHMDGWGPPSLKRGTYRQHIYAEPVQFTGFKIFYKNDTRKGHPVMTPEQILQLTPAPVYIQYQ